MLMCFLFCLFFFVVFFQVCCCVRKVMAYGCTIVRRALSSSIRRHWIRDRHQDRLVLRARCSSTKCHPVSPFASSITNVPFMTSCVAKVIWCRHLHLSRCGSVSSKWHREVEEVEDRCYTGRTIGNRP